MTQVTFPGMPKPTPPKESMWKVKPYKPAADMRRTIERVQEARVGDSLLGREEP